MEAMKKAGKAAVLPQGKDLVLIGQVGPELGVDASAIYRAGSRGELALVRVAGKWAVELAAVTTWAQKYRAAKLKAKTTIGGKVASALDPFLTTGESPPA